jgi:hypothetical protein
MSQPKPHLSNVEPSSAPEPEFLPVEESTLPRVLEPLAIVVALFGVAALSAFGAAARVYQRAALRRRLK